MNEKEIVARFFKEGYEYKNYPAVLELLAEDYLDHSPAGARSNRDAVEILKVVSGMLGDMRISLISMTCWFRRASFSRLSCSKRYLP